VLGLYVISIGKWHTCSLIIRRVQKKSTKELKCCDENRHLFPNEIRIDRPLLPLRNRPISEIKRFTSMHRRHPGNLVTMMAQNLYGQGMEQGLEALQRLEGQSLLVGRQSPMLRFVFGILAPLVEGQ